MKDHVEGGRFRRFAKLASVAALTARDLLAAEARRRVLRRDQDTFPEEVRRVLGRLLSQAPHPLARDQAAEVVARELGAPPEEAFASFAGEPMAAASMGQVHAATLRDGRDVVVKIQYPGVKRSIEADLRNVGLFARGLALAGDLFDGRSYLEEIAATLRCELDYEEEARQLEEYRAVAAPWAGRLAVPEVIRTHTSKRVLALERLRGPTLFEFAHDEGRSAAERFEVAARLVEAIWGPFLRLSAPFTRAYWALVEAALAGERADILALLPTTTGRRAASRSAAATPSRATSTWRFAAAPPPRASCSIEPRPARRATSACCAQRATSAPCSQTSFARRSKISRRS